MDLEKIRTCCESLEQDITALRMTERIEYNFYSAMIDAVQTIAAEITAPPKSNADRIRQMTDDEELLSANLQRSETSAHLASRRRKIGRSEAEWKHRLQSTQRRQERQDRE